LAKTIGKKQIAKTKGMAIGHAYFFPFFTDLFFVLSSVFRVQP
jgi:hypothetical protein